MNYLIVLEYCGTGYNGWQIQNKRGGFDDGSKTIENEVLKAVATVTGHVPKILVSGRTDAGVHALNQVANFRLPFYYDMERLRISLNGVLPADISVKSVEAAHDSFHATRDAVSKTYLYKINCGYESPLLSGKSWFVKEDLNLGLMLEAAEVFTGRHDFSCFSKIDKERRGMDRSRTINCLKICSASAGFDIFVEGGGFLRHMVRRMVGSIVLCGAGKSGAKEIADMLESASGAGKVLQAPSRGLFLHSVRYKHKIYC